MDSMINSSQQTRNDYDGRLMAKILITDDLGEFGTESYSKADTNSRELSSTLAELTV